MRAPVSTNDLLDLRPQLTSPYRVPSSVAEVAETVRRSRFLSFASRAPDEATAKAFVDELRQRYPDATHHCWAYNAGPPGETARIGMSDDGEPHGTAGRPMLHAILHSEIGEVVVVCVRYYGGTKLGTGGLARAYSSGATAALAALRTEWRIERVVVVVTVAYDVAEAVERALVQHDGIIRERTFGQKVQLTTEIPVSQEHALTEAVASVTRGTSALVRVEETQG